MSGLRGAREPETGWPQKIVRLTAKPALLSTSQDTSDRKGDSRKTLRSREFVAVIWFEAEDFLRYFDHFRNPTGTQRLSFEIYSAANLLYGHSEHVRFCRLSVFSKHLHAIRFDDLCSAFLNPLGGTAPWKTFWEPAIFWEQFPRSIPVVLRHPRSFLSIFKIALRDLMEILIRRKRFERRVRRGDTIVSLSAGWGIPGHMKHMAEAKRRYGIKFAIFVHDVLAMDFPSYFESRHAVQFGNWLQEAITVADVVLTNSKYSRARLIELAAVRWRLPRIEVLEPGSFGDRPTAQGQRMQACPHAMSCRFHVEIRKITGCSSEYGSGWGRHGADRVPIGSSGRSAGRLTTCWPTSASDYLNKIIMLRDLSDAELHQAYRRCLFTVSGFCEGWGCRLRSLAHGKFCVASIARRSPVGGNLVDYLIRRQVMHWRRSNGCSSSRVIWQRDKRKSGEYCRRTWNDCVHALMGARGRQPRRDQGVPAGRYASGRRVRQNFVSPEARPQAFRRSG